MAAQPPNHPGILAIALLTDSSLPIRSEWVRLLHDYLIPLFHRLGEGYPPPVNQIRLAFVTYGIASTRPTPLLCERFFQPPTQVNRELKEHPENMGIGFTGVGANSGGMAALEGVVTVLEMFDQLRASLGWNDNPPHPNRPRVISHVIHFAAGAPDASVNPMWNKDPRFDDLTWQTLPEEFKKRDINYSMILTRPIPRLKEVHDSMHGSDSNVSPWFNVAPHHTCSHVKVAGLKRPDAPTVSPSDPKRPRQNSTATPTPKPPQSTPTPTEPLPSTSPTTTLNLSPLVSTNAPSSVSSVPTPVVTLPPPVSVPPNPAPAPPGGQLRPGLVFSALPPAKQQEFMVQYKRILAEVKQAGEIAQTAMRENKPPEMLAALKNEYTKKHAMLQRLQQMVSANSIPGSSAPVAPPQMPTINNPVVPEVTPSNPAFSGNKSQVPSTMDPQVLLNMVKNNPQQQYPPDVMAQINKLIEHQQQQQHLQGRANIIQASPPQQNQNTAGRWQGTIGWTGTDSATNTRREMSIAVSGQCAPNSADAMTSTWPTNLRITPTQEKLVSIPDFQLWVKNNRPALCQFHPIHLPGIDSQMNDANYSALIRLLSEKNIYAMATWDLPTKRNSHNILLLPHKGGSLIGAAFPLTGIPEFPKSSGQGQMQGNPMSAAEQNMVMQTNMMQNMTPEQQEQFKQYMLNRQQQQIQQQQQQKQQQQHQAMGGMNLNDGGPAFPLRMANASPYGIGAAGMNMGGSHGGGMPGVSLEMMQSFMQRKVDGQQPQGGM